MSITTTFSISQVGFSKFQNFNGRAVQEGRIASACQILLKSVKPRPRYDYFQMFRDAAILDFQNFKLLMAATVKFVKLH